VCEECEKKRQTQGSQEWSEKVDHGYEADDEDEDGSEEDDDDEEEDWLDTVNFETGFAQTHSR
jgi:hypothetical protein